jgi:hypothetical protein
MAAALTPAIAGAIVSATGVSLATATVIATVITTVISAAISFGLQMLLAPSQKRSLTELSVEFSQSAGEVVRWSGRNLMGSQARIFWTMKDDGILDKVCVFGSGGITGVNQIWLDGAPVTLDSDGYVVDAKFQSRAGKHVRVFTTLGADDQVTIPELKTRYPSLWTDDHRARGHALIYTQNLRCDANLVPSMFPSGDAPKVAVDGNGGAFFDPRDDSTAFTANPVVALMGYLRTKHGGSFVDDDFDTQEWEDAADICDEVFDLKVTGTEPRYSHGLGYESSEERSSVITRYLRTFAGAIRLTAEGKIGIRAGKWRAPTVTVSEEHIISIESAGGDDRRTSYSKRVSKYTDVIGRFSAQTTAPFVNSDLLSSIGDVTVSGDRLEVQSHAQCARLDKAQMLFDNPDRLVTITLRFYGLLLYDAENFILDLPDLSYDEQPMWLDSWAASDDFTTFTITARTADPTSFDWDAATEEPDQPVSEVLPGQTGGVPDLVDIDVEVITEGGEQRMKVSWTDEPDYEAVCQISEQGEEVYSKLTIEAGGDSAEIDLTDTTVDYKIRAYWAIDASTVLAPGDPGTGNQVLIENIEPLASSDVLDSPIVTSHTAAGFIRTVAFVPDFGANYFKTVIRRTDTNEVMGTDFATGGDNSITFTLATGIRNYELVSINPTDVESAPVDLGTFTGPGGGG